MSAEYQETQPFSPPQSLYHRHSRQRHGHISKRVVALARKTFTYPKTYVILLVLSFVLGFLCHTHPNILPEDAKDLLTFHNQCADQIPSPLVRRTILNIVFNNTSPWRDFPPPSVSSLLWEEPNKGWGSTNAVFEHLIHQVRPKTIIQVGTFRGTSAIHMAKLNQELDVDAQILCIDDFRRWPGYYDEEKSLNMVNGDNMLLYLFMQNVVQTNATDSIMFLPFSTTTALGALCQWGVYGDLVEVASAHDYHSAWMDINNAYIVLAPGGVLFGNDYDLKGVRKAVHLFARLNGFRVKIDGNHWVLY